MPVFDSTARKQVAPEPTFRAAPHNIEAEQALLGAILVNNEAFYRVSDYLEPMHFFEPIHQRIFDLTGGLIRANKIATPVTLKTFLPGDIDIADAIERVLTEDWLRADLSARGLARAGRFTWEETARRTAAVLHEAAGD